MGITLKDVHESFDILQAHARSRVDVNLDAWVNNLPRFLESRPEIKGEVKILDIKRGSGGSVNGNLIFRAQLDTGDGRKSENYVVRYSAAKGLENQFKIQKALIESGVPAANPLWMDAAGEFFGIPAFVMEFIDAEVPLQSYFTVGPLAEASPDDRRIMISNVIKTVAKIHEMDWKERGLGFLLENGEVDTLLDKELVKWYLGVDTFAPDQKEALYPAFQWLKENQPEVSDPVFVHNDSNMANFMFRGIDVAAVLDFGESHIGPRELDLAAQNNANHLLGIGLNEKEGIPSEAQWLAEYEKISGYKVRDWEYYTTFALFRLSVVMLFFTMGIPDILREKTKDVSLYWQNQLMDRLQR
jgi:aminoglycoside phosphotransferase (APT) family kinase protein